MSKAVIGLGDSEFQTERIVEKLKGAGFSNNDISVLFPDKSGTRDFAHEQNTKLPEGAATGAGTGGVLGGRFRLAGGYWRPGDSRRRPIYSRGSNYGCTRRCGCRRSCWRANGCVSRLGHPGVRSQAVRGKNQTRKHSDLGTLGR